MSTAIFTLLVLTAIHFVLDRIIIPNELDTLRLKLYAVRDKLRSYRISHPEEIDDWVFSKVDNSINNAIRHLPQFTLSLLVSAKRVFEKDHEMNDRLDQMTERLESVKDDHVQRVMLKTNKYVMLAIALNMGGWIIYAFPIIVIYVLYSAIRGYFVGFRKRIVSKLTLANESDYRYIAHRMPNTATC